MLFIPWIYKELEEERVGSTEVERRARKYELRLVLPLLASETISGKEWGIFGRSAGSDLKRLPSSIYWASLWSWGIRRFEGSQNDYHRALDHIYRLREQGNRQRGERRQRAESTDVPAPNTLTWCTSLRAPPEEFPKVLGFHLREKEARFLLDRILFSHRESLLAHLANRCSLAEVKFPWEHPERTSFSLAHQELLKHAQIFSATLHGAALLYNLALARLKRSEELLNRHGEAMKEWAEEICRMDLKAWSLPRFWELTHDEGHRVTSATIRFVERWVEFARNKPSKLIENERAIEHIKCREMKLKGARSRFKNARALDQWSGSAGLDRLSFRWPIARELLRDLYNGLNCSE